MVPAYVGFISRALVNMLVPAIHDLEGSEEHIVCLKHTGDQNRFSEHASAEPPVKTRLGASLRR